MQQMGRVMSPHWVKLPLQLLCETHCGPSIKLADVLVLVLEERKGALVREEVENALAPEEEAGVNDTTIGANRNEIP